jgi:drug/metabolite transporter (DMT)-like permease
MLVAVGFFAFMDTVLKVLSTRYPALQVAALRGWVALPLVLLWIQWRHAWHTLLHIRWPLHLLRGVLAIAMLSLFTRGLQGLPLANAYTLFFIAPLLITLLSSRVLGERVPRAHWWAVAGGMLGVLVALRPGMDGFVSWSGLAVLSSAACYAISAVVGRLSIRTDSSESLMLWIMVMAVCWPRPSGSLSDRRMPGCLLYWPWPGLEGNWPSLKPFVMVRHLPSPPLNTLLWPGV